VRVLILHSRYRSGPASGENRVVEDEARLLVESGHDVDVFVPETSGTSGLQMIRAGLEVIWSPDAVGEVKRRVHHLKPDIIHCHNLFPWLSPAVLRAVDGAVPIAMTVHNYRLLCLPGTFVRGGRICEDCLSHTLWPGVLHRCYQQSLAASAALATSLSLHKRIGSFDRIRLYIAISNFVRRIHVESGLAGDKITVKPHFAWPVPRREGPGNYFVYLGRLSPEKGVTTLVKAWNQVEGKLLIIGDGPESGSVRALAGRNVEFKGTVHPADVPALLRGARALVVPSISHEGAGKVVLEAYAAGVPALVSKAGGLPEVVQDGVTGLVLPAGDAGAWASAVERLLEDSESERMGQAAWELWSEDFTPEKGLQNLESAYRRTLG
jgi:glycosyltransferase involved in cell wall biosynthesis